MNKTLYVLAFIMISGMGYSQGPDSLLKSIEVNNPMIKASLKWLEAEKSRSRTGIYPDNPDITYNYLWGSPDAIGNQQEFEITQKFRFPGYYFARSSMQKMEFGQSEIIVEKTKNDILFKAQNEIITLIWLTKKELTLSKKLKESSDLLTMMQQGYERKEFSKPALDKVRIYHLNNQTEMAKLKSEILVHHETLQQLNGGIPVNFILNDYAIAAGLPSFDTLQSRLMEFNPDIRIANLTMDLSGEKVKVEYMNRLPKIEAGYKGETILNQKLQGIHTGISIPLWENKNKVKQAKIEENWSQLNYDQVVSEITSNLKAVYSNAQSVFLNYLNIKEIATDPLLSENTFLLLKTGELSFPEYLTEVQLIFENQMNFLEVERDYQILLNKITLLTGK
jgi:outer membrane protein, heavy metal efflux system